MKGSKGAAVVMHDVGKHQEDMLDATLGRSSQRVDVPSRIPEWVYTTGSARAADTALCTKAAWQRHRPDIMLVTGNKHTTVRHRRVHTVEIKYCRDTDPTAQTERAHEQHAQLHQHLARIGYRKQNLHHHAILLGVAGTIYKDIYPTLHMLGVSKGRSKTLTRKLHYHAIAQAEIIMTTKWHQESLQKQPRHGVG